MNNEKVNLHNTMDAVIWAKEFKKIFPDSDESLMLTWFANSIMCGYDHATSKYEDLVKKQSAAIELIKFGLINASHETCDLKSVDGEWKLNQPRNIAILSREILTKVEEMLK